MFLKAKLSKSTDLKVSKGFTRYWQNNLISLVFSGVIFVYHKNNDFNNRKNIICQIWILFQWFFSGVIFFHKKRLQKKQEHYLLHLKLSNSNLPNPLQEPPRWSGSRPRFRGRTLRRTQSSGSQGPRPWTRWSWEQVVLRLWLAKRTSRPPLERHPRNNLLLLLLLNHLKCEKCNNNTQDERQNMW